MSFRTFSGLLLLTLTIFLFAAARIFADELMEGAYLVKIAGCADCHSADANLPMAGGYKLKTPFGSLYTPNITPDLATGIGKWSEENFNTALRKGVSPTGSIYYPAFPYRAFSKISDSDLHKMWLYMRSLSPIEQRNRAPAMPFPFNQRWLLFFWQEFFFRGPKFPPDEFIKFGVGPFQPDEGQSPEWNRGAYLVEAFAHCTECHTSRNVLGSLEPDVWMAGAIINGNVIPNITPDPKTGLPEWTLSDWQRFLGAGLTPKGQQPGQEMALVIQNTSSLTKADRMAMATYLTSLKPAHHSIQNGELK
jgi:mono/diheme cytochrome c family protein